MPVLNTILEILSSFDSVFRDIVRSTIDSAIDFDDTSEFKSLVPICMMKWSGWSFIAVFYNRPYIVLLRWENFLYKPCNYLSFSTSPNIQLRCITMLSPNMATDFRFFCSLFVCFLSYSCSEFFFLFSWCLWPFPVFANKLRLSVAAFILPVSLIKIDVSNKSL